jgi:hypothetical protein
VPPEIAEINEDPSLHRESIGVFASMTTVFSLIPVVSAVMLEPGQAGRRQLVQSNGEYRRFVG